jgi:hypothetical protein
VMKAAGLVLGNHQHPSRPVSEAFEHTPIIIFQQLPCQDSAI